MNGETGSRPHPHGTMPVSAFGAAPEEARAAVVLLHGHGATAGSILDLARHLDGPEGVAWLAPQAAGNTWYPRSFLSPTEENQPYLDSALRRVGEVTDALAERGVPAERTVLAGFSQGACLAAESAARRARRWGGVAAFTGGLIGHEVDLGSYEGRHEGRHEKPFDGTPALLAAGDPDPHVPWVRMEESAEVYEALGAEVSLRRYPGMGHTVNDEELAWLRHRLEELVATP